ncbi:MAG: CmpA/NrtA family ABC transporter substrate-binding protein [Planctomycetota bacterium]
MPADNTPLIEQHAWVGRTDELEKTSLDLGFIPLSDCAPLAVAYEKGFFERHGLRVTLHREASWASIRDKTMLGLFDAAHMLYPMPIASTLGIGGVKCPMVTGICLSLGGNAITVSNKLHDEMTGRSSDFTADRSASAAVLKKTIEARHAAGKGPLRFGVVFPTSTHHYELRFWMASAGIDPDQDVKIMVVPPPEMPNAMRSGKIDGYCVGEPWNSYAVERGWGKTLITKQELWNNAPEKVLGTTKKWADEHPKTHRALVRAVLEACVWSDKRANREEVASIIAQSSYIDAPLDAVKTSMLGQFRYELDRPAEPMPDFMSFHRYATNFPWHSHAKWFLTQMLRWGQIVEAPGFNGVAEQVMLSDLYREAAKELGVASPLINDKTEGTHNNNWVLENTTSPIKMGSDQMIGNVCFDPSDPQGYLQNMTGDKQAI